MREPKRGLFSFVKKGQMGRTGEFPVFVLLKQYLAIMSVGCIRWNFAGVFFRFWAATTVAQFSLRYMNAYNMIA